MLWLVKKLHVARSGYYSWLQRQSNPGKRAKQDEEIAADIEVVFKTHRSRYGSPRIHQELRGKGRHIGRKRLERLMKRQGYRHYSADVLGVAPNKKRGIKLQQIYYRVNLIQQNKTDTGAVILPTSAPQKVGAILLYGWIYIQGEL